MRIYTADEKRTVDVGMGSIWYSIYSTATVALSDDAKKSIPLAMAFLKTGECAAELAKKTQDQLERVREAFSTLGPDRAIYDLHKPDMPPPWSDNIASSVTSCANLYTTADGKDLFTEALSLLKYAAEKNISVFAG